MRHLLIILGVTALLSGEVFCAELKGRVVRVADGDTFTLMDTMQTQYRIRIDGIDAPERAQPFGERSREALLGFIYQREVIANCLKIDRYQRQVCKVFVAGTDVGLEQIRKGMAWHFKRYQGQQDKDRESYAHEENSAQAKRTGLWQDAKPIPPWEWRKLHAY